MALVAVLVFANLVLEVAIPGLVAAIELAAAIPELAAGVAVCSSRLLVAAYSSYSLVDVERANRLLVAAIRGQIHELVPASCELEAVEREPAVEPVSIERMLPQSS